MGAFLGIVFHAIGGFAAGSFYIPMNRIRGWSWESGWLILGITAWVLAPWTVAALTVPRFQEILQQGSASVLGWTFLFGLLWGVGNLTFGLTMRYLGLSLGMALALGLTAAFGTLVPPVVAGEFTDLFTHWSGRLSLIGILVCLLGIGVCGYAGIRKERELPDEQARETIREFNLRKGIGVAVVAGILSACFAFGLQSGQPLAEAALQTGTDTLYQNNVVLIVILAGGFLTNAAWCVYLNFRNRSFDDYTRTDAPLAKNYLATSLGGLTWYLQFFFYGMGTTRLAGSLEFASWTLHMAFIILFSNLWGLYFQEWRGVSRTTYATVATGLALLVLSTVVIGLGSYLA